VPNGQSVNGNLGAAPIFKKTSKMIAAFLMN